MSMYIDIADYEVLYARYLEKPVSELIDLAGDVKGKVVWDLCCGGGWIAGECLKRGAAFVCAVDACSAMTRKLRTALASSNEVMGRRISLDVVFVDEWLYCDVESKPDFVFCRQAVNYWLNEGTVARLSERMAPGSVFVFNTFRFKPPVKPVVKEYDHGGASYVETSWLVEPDTVHHVQARSGMAPHVTTFRWIAPSEYMEFFGNGWDVAVTERRATSLYRCVRT